MRHMFFSREINHGLIIPPRLKTILTNFSCQNVVSHVTFAAANTTAHSKIYGIRRRPKIPCSLSLAPYTLFKKGIACKHHRINTIPVSKNHGKYLVFHSSQMIRAGKHTHAMAMHVLNVGVCTGPGQVTILAMHPKS